MTIYTIGHSTRQLEEFIALLKQYDITQLVDIRSIPRSRHNSQYEQTALEKTLPEHGIRYIYLKSLGGLRHVTKDSENLGWHNLSFRNYADYMQTPEFQAGIDELIEIAKKAPSAIMCAEAVPWRCHRSLVGDALTVRGVDVEDIISEKSMKKHRITPFAVVDGEKITYPNDELKTH